MITPWHCFWKYAVNPLSPRTYITGHKRNIHTPYLHHQSSLLITKLITPTRISATAEALSRDLGIESASARTSRVSVPDTGQNKISN